MANERLLVVLQLLFHKKTKFCKHRSPDCITNAVHGFLSNLKTGLMIRGVITLLSILLKKQKITEISLLGQLVFPCFLASFAFVLKFVLCFLRRYRGKDDGLNAFAAGFLAGFTLLINKDEHTRKMFALYLLARAYDSTQTILDEKGIIPNLGKNQHMIWLIVVNLTILWSFFMEFNKNLSPSWYGIMNNLYSIHKEPNERIWQKILHKKLNVWGEM
jgi:hypothetical protein